MSHKLILNATPNTGVWGSPTFVVDGEIFWGVDRLWMVEVSVMVRVSYRPRISLPH